MLDIALIRENPARIKELSLQKNVDAPVDDILQLDEKRRTLLTQVEQLKAQRNSGSKAIGRTKDADERQQLIAEMSGLGDRIGELDDEVRSVEASLNDLMLSIPNIPDPEVPVGPDANSNTVREQHGDHPQFDFEPKPHWEIGEALGIIDFDRGVKVSGTRNYILRKDGARLQRALVAWMLDVHTRQSGYEEVIPPHLVLSESLVATGNLPKFADTLFRDIDEDKWLIPTAEVPITNMYRDEILPESSLPIYHTAATQCFRREQISGGREVRGIKRGYEFHKVELVKFVHPDHGDAELESLLRQALLIVEGLSLPYRVLDLATGDMTFSSAHTYDVEVWAAGTGEWLEVSSCSLFRDYQARRANIRYRPEEGGRPQLVYTLNGSGLALPRTIIAILENYQQADGSVLIPEILRPYMGGQEFIGGRSA
jgi:seryl-tRNA synthetase